MRLPALEADAPAPRGLRPDESEPDARDDGFSERNAARHRWGHCAWFTDGGVCLWGGRPGMDNRNVLMYGRGGTLARVRFDLTRRRRAFPHPPRIPEPNARPPPRFRARALPTRVAHALPHRLPSLPLHRRHAAARAHSHSRRMPRVARVSHVRPRQARRRGRARLSADTAPRPDRTTTRARPSTTRISSTLHSTGAR